MTAGEAICALERRRKQADEDWRYFLKQGASDERAWFVARADNCRAAAKALEQEIAAIDRAIDALMRDVVD